ncbi:AraC family transcriptional regulator [Exilibacterium tricleocarpae]|nr:AraC family transcriptional regulator [Exilibacterium tricleocarpae]
MDTDHNCLLFSSPLVSAGTFDCPVTAPDFTNTGPIDDYLLAFPRTAVKIRHREMRRAIVADPNIVTIYNKGQEYERYPLSPYGDRCDWLTVCPATVCEMLNSLGVRQTGDPDRLFQVTHSMSSPAAYASLRRLIADLHRHPATDAVAVEETVLRIFQHTLCAAYAERGPAMPKRRATGAKHSELVRQTCELLATRYTDPLSVALLAREVNTSAYHLCRVFRRLTGATIHCYLTQLRLRASLQAVSEPRSDLATLGINLGFSDHSHFSQSFRKAFGITPSEYRRTCRVTEPRQLSLH